MTHACAIYRRIPGHNGVLVAYRRASTGILAARWQAPARVGICDARKGRRYIHR